jgi:hypothetical protein
MKPREALNVLDGRIRILESNLERKQPGSNAFNWLSAEIAALKHATRLIAFEVQYLNERRECGMDPNRKAGEFLREVVQGAPKDELSTGATA